MLPERELSPTLEDDSDSWGSDFSSELESDIPQLEFTHEFGDAMYACEGELTEVEKEEMFNQILRDVEAAVSQEHPVMVEKDCCCDA